MAGNRNPSAIINDIRRGKFRGTNDSPGDGRETPPEPTVNRNKVRMSHYEKCRAAVYATGNKWAIENWEATH